MGQHAADLAGVAEVPVTIEDSAKGLVKQVSINSLAPALQIDFDEKVSNGY